MNEDLGKTPEEMQELREQFKRTVDRVRPIIKEIDQVLNRHKISKSDFGFIMALMAASEITLHPKEKENEMIYGLVSAIRHWINFSEEVVIKNKGGFNEK